MPPTMVGAMPAGVMRVNRLSELCWFLIHGDDFPKV